MSVRASVGPPDGRWSLGLRTTSCVLVIMLASGCMVRRGELATRSQRELRRRTQVVETGVPNVTVRQEDDRLHVVATSMCDRVTYRDVETTEHYGREISNPGMLVTLALGAVATGVAGGLFAANVFGYPPMSVMSPSDEGLSQEASVVGGVLLLAVSGVLTTVTLGNLFRLPGTDDETSQQALQDPSGSAPEICDPPVPVVGAGVSLQLAEPLDLGRTDASGLLSVDVAAIAPPRWVLEQPTTVPVLVNGRRTGDSFDLRAMRLDLDERVWARAGAGRCAIAQEPAECEDLSRYLAVFPRGLHADEAHRIQAEANRRFAERAARQEEQRRLEEERRLAEDARRREEEERRYREEQERWEREAAASRAAAERRREDEALQRERRARRAECQRGCAQTCSGDRACMQACVNQQCR